jgi:hypothetical protein
MAPRQVSPLLNVRSLIFHFDGLWLVHLRLFKSYFILTGIQFLIHASSNYAPSATGRSLVQRSPTECDVYLTVIK